MKDCRYMKHYRIDKTKNIGNVIFVVEGGRPEQITDERGEIGSHFAADDSTLWRTFLRAGERHRCGLSVSWLRHPVRKCNPCLRTSHSTDSLRRRTCRTYRIASNRCTMSRGQGCLRLCGISVHIRPRRR